MNDENIITVNVANGVSICIMAAVGVLIAMALRKMAGKKSGSGVTAGPGATAPG